jgi:uncharacterized membrane protein YjdF
MNENVVDFQITIRTVAAVYRRCALSYQFIHLLIYLFVSCHDRLGHMFSGIIAFQVLEAWCRRKEDSQRKAVALAPLGFPLFPARRD